MFRLTAAPLLVLLGACATSSPSQGSGTSQGSPSASSGQSVASSGQSAASSAQSQQSSAASTASSQQSSASNASSQNSAQGTAATPSSQQSGGVLAASSLLGTTAATVGLTVYFAYWKGRADAPPKAAAVQQARAWLRANHLQLDEDLALGAGPALDDLATMARVPPAHRARLGQVLRRHHAQLHPSAEPSLDEAQQLMARVGACIFEDEVLRADGEAALARW